MDAEDFEFAVATIILLRRVRERSFKRKLRKQWVRAIKEKEEMQKGKTFIIQTLAFITSAKVSSSLKLNLFVFLMFMIFFQLMNAILKIFNMFNKSNYLFTSTRLLQSLSLYIKMVFQVKTNKMLEIQ